MVFIKFFLGPNCAEVTKLNFVSNSILLTTEKDYERISSDFKFEIKYIKAKIKINDQDRFIDEIKKFI